MPSQREIRRRIGSVKNIRQITRAMQFVAASKLKRAQDATLASRPYGHSIDEVIADLASVLGEEGHPLLRTPESGAPRTIVLFTTDRGLAGALNSNLIRFALKELETAGAGSTIITIGKKGRDALARGGYEISAAFPGYGDKPTFGDITPLVSLLVDDFLSGRSAGVTLIHPAFISTLTQRPEAVQLLPIRASADTAGIPGNQFLFEPDPAAVLEALLPRYVATRIYQGVLETTACEQSSRMVAMKNATENAGDLISDLTLTYNKVRQSNITREMIEIASGASAN
jgi:F-type H+-transporting ATPase subunit gamma|uniref:ATP synthase F1 subunit gamma n=1 Tax=Candidatus Limnocylindrus sp. TaxID=2802978 RepID=UPI00404A8790